MFWEPNISPHKSDLFNALTAITGSDIEVLVCADRDLLPERAAMGWSRPLAVRHREIIAPDERQVEHLVTEQATTTLHIVSGMRHVPTIVSALAAIRRHGARFALMSEPRASEGLRGAIRYLQSRLTEGWLRQRTEFVLAIGRHGPAWFRAVGYPRDRIFPYAYFVAPPAAMTSSSGSTPELKVAYVGRLIRQKGVADLIDAMAELGPNHRLTVVGDGPERHNLAARCQTRKVTADFTGVLPMDRIGTLLAGVDVLALASTATDDGWGVVVGEALMTGTAAVASRCVGASIVLDDPRLGRVIPPRTPSAIAEAIRDLHSNGGFTADARRQRRQLAISMLAPEAGVNALLDIVHWCDGKGERPLPYLHPPGQL